MIWPLWERKQVFCIVIVICLPTENLGVLMNSFKHVRAFQIELEFGNVGF